MPSLASEASTCAPSVAGRRSSLPVLLTQSSRSSYSVWSDVKKAPTELEPVWKKPSIQMHFPMYVIKVKDVLQLGEVKSHQELKRMGKLIEYRSGMTVLFISHQWTGKNHPDPDMTQFKVLQDTIRNLADGKAYIGVCPMTTMITGRTFTFTDPHQLENVMDMYIWYDYISIMQPSMATAEEEEAAKEDMLAAVKSIPAYVEMCSFFIALTPGMAHDESGEALFYTSWLGRGWCRAEHTAWSLMGRPALVLVGPTFLVEAVLNVQWVFHAPFRGVFGVESDRERVDTMMRTMLDLRVERMKRAGEIFFWRFLNGLGQHYVQRKGYQADMEKWLREYDFVSPVDAGKERSWLPIHYAALEGNCDMVQKLVAAGASVHSTTRQAHDAYFAFKKMTPAAIAALYVPSDVALPLLRTLAQLGADLHAKDSKGQTLLQMAVLGLNKIPVIQYLLDNGLDIDARTREGNTPLHLACLVGRSSHCKYLLDQGADLSAVNEFEQGMLVSASPFGSCGTVDALLHAGAQPDVPVPATAKMRFLSACAAIGLRVKKEMILAAIIKNIPGVTPLHVAAYLGDLGSVQLLLRAGADPKKTNHYGLDALDFCSLGSDATEVRQTLLAGNVNDTVTV